MARGPVMGKMFEPILTFYILCRYNICSYLLTLFMKSSWQQGNSVLFQFVSGLVLTNSCRTFYFVFAELCHVST